MSTKAKNTKSQPPKKTKLKNSSIETESLSSDVPFALKNLNLTKLFLQIRISGEKPTNYHSASVVAKATTIPQYSSSLLHDIYAHLCQKNHGSWEFKAPLHSTSS